MTSEEKTSREIYLNPVNFKKGTYFEKVFGHTYKLSACMLVFYFELKIATNLEDTNTLVHETVYASSGNKHFFTKLCHRQTYQNYEQSRQKLGTILENKVCTV